MILILKGKKMGDEISYQDINILATNEGIRNKAMSRSEGYDRLGHKGYQREATADVV